MSNPGYNGNNFDDNKISVEKLPLPALSSNDSNDPSYSKLVLPYWVICRQRYRTAAAKQRAQFIKEINRHELLQIKALDGVRIHRGFSNPVICQAKPKELVQLTAKQRMRIEDILERPF